jgi:polar amino acid transport system substrate-binding protein
MKETCIEESPLNVGFIGCGGFMRGNHLPNTAKNPQLRVHALCDLDQKILDVLSTQYRPCYTTMDAQKLWSDPELDFVVIGTQPDTRVPLIRSAAQAGVPLYVEKPLSVGWEDSREILEILHEHPVPLQVGFNRPYSSAMQEARRIFRRQRGPKTMISYRICGEFQIFPQHHKDTLTTLGESAVVHEGVHIFDLLNWFTESEPLSVYCMGGATDDNIIILEYPQETRACIIASNQSTEGFPKERMEVFTNYSTLVMNEFMEVQVAQIPGEANQLFPLKSFPGGQVNKLLKESELRSALCRWRSGLSEEEIATGYYYGSRPCVDKGHYRALEYFRQCLVTGQPIETDARRGALATVTALEALRSLRERRVVDLDFAALEAREALLI